MYVPVAPSYIVSPADQVLLSEANVSCDRRVGHIQQALSHAREAFPQLKRLRDASLSLSVPAAPAQKQLVGISAPAWPTFITHVTRYQIIDVHVTQVHECESERDKTVPIPDITITYADADDVERTEPAPPYSGPDVVDDEKAAYPQSRPRSPSLSTLHPGKRNWLLQKFHGQ